MERNKIKFTAQDKKEFMLELREKIAHHFEKNQISEYGNFNLVVKTIFMFLLYFSPYVLMLTGIIHSFAGVLLCWVIMGFGKAGIGMAVMHDANHKSYSSNRKVN